jgi:hypothetical protein
VAAAETAATKTAAAETAAAAPTVAEAATDATYRTTSRVGGGGLSTVYPGMFHVDTKKFICVFVKIYLRANKRSTRNIYLCHK